MADITYVPQFKRQGVEWVDLMVTGHYDLTPISQERAEAEVEGYRAVVEDSGLRPNDGVEFRVIKRTVTEEVVREWTPCAP